MKITAVRVSKLVSGPGYNNTSVAAEAIVEKGDNPETVHSELCQWVDKQLGLQKDVRELNELRDELRTEVMHLERRRDSLREKIKRIDSDLQDEIPF